MSSTSSTSASLFTNAADGGLHRRARPVRQAAADASGRRRRGEAAVVVVVVAAGVVCVCGTGSRSSSSGRCCCAVVVPAGTSSSGRTRRRLRTSPCNRCSCCCCSCPGSRSCFLNSPSSPCSCCRRAAPHRRRAPTSDQALERRTDLSVQRHDPVDVGVDVPDQRAVAFEGLGGAFLVVAVDLAEEDSGFFFVFFFFSGRVRVEKAAESYQMLFLFLSLSLLPISHHSQIWPILLVLVEELLHAHERLGHTARASATASIASSLADRAWAAAAAVAALPLFAALLGPAAAAAAAAVVVPAAAAGAGDSVPGIRGPENCTRRTTGESCSFSLF